MLSADKNPGSAIVFSSNGYMFNADGSYNIDIYEIDDCYTKALAPTLAENEKIAYLERIIELYNGKYMPSLSDDVLAMIAAEHYEHIFISAVNILSELYLAREDMDKLFEVCDKALLLKPVEESVYISVIKGLVRTNQIVRAISLCEKYFLILNREMGIEGSEQMRDLYATMKTRGIAGINSHPMLSDNNSEAAIKRSFNCSLKAFEDICLHELRQIGRKDTSGSIISVISLNNKSGKIPPINVLHKPMKHLFNSCICNIRKGDVFAEYTKHQYIVLLMNVTRHSLTSITKRIQDHFYNNCSQKDVYLNFSNKPLAESKYLFGYNPLILKSKV
jgi:DNA-binding SARP family transcriptional activator